MSEVSRRITESLDLETVLQEVVDCACSLTEAQYGALSVIDDSGRVNALFTCGITLPADRTIGPMPTGRGLIGYLNEVRAPLRLADLSKHPRSDGLPDFLPPMKTFLGTPIRHLGDAVGNLYLTEKEGGEEFTAEDEETLVMFASQAAMAIANAQSYGDERQARSDAEDERTRLETLVNASPAGGLDRRRPQPVGGVRQPGGATHHGRVLAAFLVGSLKMFRRYGPACVSRRFAIPADVIADVLLRPSFCCRNLTFTLAVKYQTS